MIRELQPCDTRCPPCRDLLLLTGTGAIHLVLPSMPMASRLEELVVGSKHIEATSPSAEAGCKC
jgi:hypothetical protein